MELNIFTLVENFLSDYQKSDKNFTELLNIIVQSLGMKTFKHGIISPVNFTTNISKFHDIDEMSEDEIYERFKSVLPFSDKRLIDEILELIPIQSLIKILKKLYLINGSKNYLEFWNNIAGNIIYNSRIDKTSDSENTINDMSLLNVNRNEINIYTDNYIPNVVSIDNIFDIKFEDMSIYLSFINEIKNINSLFLIVFSTTWQLDYNYDIHAMQPYLIQSIHDTSMYYNDLYFPFIRQVSNVSNRNIDIIAREKLNNFYQYRDIHRVKLGEIKNKGSINVYSYGTDDNIIYYPISQRQITHIDVNNGYDVMYDNEILNSPDDINIYNLHVQPPKYNGIIMLNFSVITIITVVEKGVESNVVTSDNESYMSF